MAEPKNQARREAVRLHVEEHLGNNEIARRLGVSRGSVSRWLRGRPPGKKGRTIRKTHPTRKESWTHRVIEGQGLTKQRKGKIAEAAVLFRLVLHGFNVFGSVFDGDSADWIVENPNTHQTYRLQVRWARSEKHGLPVVRLRFGSGRGKTRPPRQGDFDFLVGYDLFTNTCYVWSWEEVKHLSSTVTICPEAEERWDKLSSISPIPA